MAVWLALLVAPFLALADQSVALAMTSWACAGQHELALRVVHVPFLLATIAAAVWAWVHWRRTAAPAGDSESVRRSHFMAGLGIAVAALSSLAIVAVWAPTWVLSSCLQ
jgi:hypothetical protein